MTKTDKLLNKFIYVFMIIFALLAFFPILFVFSNSLMSGLEIVNRYTAEITAYNMQNVGNASIHFVEMSVLPYFVTFKQYIELLLRSPHYLRLFWNSVIIVLPIVVGQCIVSTTAAYAFERMKWKHKEAVYFIYIITMLMPMQVLLVPQFIVASTFNINGNYLAIILPGVFNPFGVFLIRQQLKGFPHECYEAAQIDGSSQWVIFTKIVLPNLKSIVAAMVVLIFAEYWNVVDQAVVFIKEKYDEPLSVYLAHLISGDTEMIFAVSCFYMLPAVIIFLIGQDNIKHGISLSGVKN